MREMRRVGAIAAGVAGMVLMSGCGSEAAGDGKPGAKASPSQSSTAPTAEPTPTEPATPTPTEPEFPDTPAGRFDKLADEKGWFVDDDGTLPSDYVATVCDSMTEQETEDWEPGQWLAEEEVPDPSPTEILKAGMPKLCPKWSKVALAALEGDFERIYSGGTYKVAAKAGVPDPETEEVAITPGTYRTRDDVEDCYWERTTRSGEIIDNNFATSAQEIRVTIQASDGQFTTEGCGSWRKVR
ncbi:hypothetical protein [Streptomyces xantholiticus]|uniref:Lipoprotein n=1 Tax=Streptomyces xantholiticus TaxID=68285 RepID=A0ABV1UZV5_9ACTN